VLNREKLAKELFLLVSKLFPDTSSESDLAKKKWVEICKDVTFQHRSEASQSSFLIPRWDGSLSDKFLIDKEIGDHTVIAIDGSQIYPDRHVAGAGCFLINTGGIVLKYGADSIVSFFSEPEVLIPELLGVDRALFSRDIIDLKREQS